MSNRIPHLLTKPVGADEYRALVRDLQKQLDAFNYAAPGGRVALEAAVRDANRRVQYAWNGLDAGVQWALATQAKREAGK